MGKTLEQYKDDIIAEVDNGKETFLEILSHAVQCNTDNPPGDTRSLADYLKTLLPEWGLSVTIYDPVKMNPNVHTFIGEENGRPHLGLNGEPYAPDVVGVGERGAFWFILRVDKEPMHGSLSAGDSAIIRMAEALIALKPILKDKAQIPPEMVDVIETEKTYTRSPQDIGRQWMLDHPSYNVGVIRGGTKINVVPRYCEAEVDIRLPLGMSLEYAEKRVRSLLSEVGGNDLKIMPLEFCDEPTYTPLDNPLVKIVKANATKITGKEPIYFIGMDGTDGRLYRQRGVPAVIYGPRPFNMGGIDEYILIEDYLNVIKVQACSIIEFLGVK